MSSPDPSPPLADAPRRRSDSDGVPWLLRPVVDFVARIDARLETKLLGGFLAISVLMLVLGLVSLFVVYRMDSQVDRMTTLVSQRDRAQEML
jgi:hypothetical protein